MDGSPYRNLAAGWMQQGVACQGVKTWPLAVRRQELQLVSAALTSRDMAGVASDHHAVTGNELLHWSATRCSWPTCWRPSRCPPGRGTS